MDNFIPPFIMRVHIVTLRNLGAVRSVSLGVGVHQGSVLSPLLFILVLEALSHKFHTGVLWDLFLADDLVLIASTQEVCISKAQCMEGWAGK